MKPRNHFLPPRQSVVYGYTRRMLDDTALDATAFAMRVAERYLAITAPDVRQVKLRLGEGADLIRAMENNGQVLRRYMDGTVKVLPADLEDAWVMALPEPYRSDCERDLARRRGRYSVEVPAADASGDCASIGKVISESGELCSEWGRAIANQELTASELHRIENESDGVIAAVLGLRAYARERRAGGSG
jgi:hypothetical protein